MIGGNFCSRHGGTTSCLSRLRNPCTNCQGSFLAGLVKYLTPDQLRRVFRGGGEWFVEVWEQLAMEALEREQQEGRTMQFQVNDRVRLKRVLNGVMAEVGGEGIVTEVASNDYTVEFDYGATISGLTEDDIELAERDKS